MARIFHDEPVQGPGSTNGTNLKDITFFKAEWQDHIELPGANFIADADIVRDGQNLILEAPDGTTIMIEGYFNTDPAPDLTTADGAILTPELIDSFVQYAGPVQYAQSATASDVSPVGAVHEISGDATVTRVDGSTESITIGTPIYQGDIIETDETGAVNITFIDESTFAVSEHARLAIDEYVYDPASDSGTSNFSLLRGVFVFTSGLIGREDPDDVNIETPIGSIGIRGTTIAGTINPDGESQITVTEGAIVVRNGSGEQTLSNQFETVRMNGYNDAIENIGVLDLAAMQQTFNVLRVVSADFFAAIGANGSNENDPQTDGQPESEASDANENDGTNTENVAPSEESSLDDPNNQTDILTETVSFDGSSEENFDGETDIFSEETNNDPIDNATTETTTDTTAAGSDPAAGNTNTQTQNTINTTTEQPLPPPPNNDGTTTLPPTTILELTTISAFDGFFIAGLTGEGLGHSLAFFGDDDFDGFDNFLVTNNLSSGTEILIDTGLTNIATIPGNPTTNVALSSAGDFDGDGIIDFVVGSPNITGGGGGFVESSVSGAILLSGQDTGINDPDLLGESVAGIGDINGDGLFDVIFGAPGQDSGGVDSGAAYVIFGGTAIPTDITTLSTEGFEVGGIAAGDNLGSDVSAAGDFNNDGFADFAIAEAGQSRVHIGFGSNGMSGLTLGADTLQLNNIVVNSAEKEIPIFHMGDTNGDGISDIALFSTGRNTDGDADLEGELYVIYGKNSYAGGQALDVQSMAATDGFKLSITDPNSVIIGGGSAGDFNGDGFDDGVVVLRDGNIADIYVLYGHPGAMNMTDAMLDDPTVAFHMTYDIGNTSPFHFEISTAGDYDGDGFDDLIIGTPDENGGDGGVTLVYGRDDDFVGADGNMIHAAGRTTAMPDVIANGANQHLLGDAGNNILDMNGFADVSMRGGAGDDLLIVSNAIPGNMDGGTGVDKVEFWGPSVTFDYASKGSEYLADIEKFVMMDNNQTLRLGFDSIYQLMQDSQETEGGRKVLKISDLSGGTTSLDLVKDDGGSPTPFTGSVFGFSGDAGDVNDGGITFDVYHFGTGYSLLIDQNIDTVNLVV